MLRQKGIQVAVPALTSSEGLPTTYWQQHATAVRYSLRATPSNSPLILVGHSGGGMLLPAIRQIIEQPVAAYIFVDAGLPEDGKSRLDLFGNVEASQRFRQAAKDGFLPTWSDEELRDVIPADEPRRRLVAELRPVSLAVYEEPIPVFNGWPDAPCAYLRFGANPAYEVPAERARQDGWECIELQGEHFHMLIDPSAVTEALIELCKRMGIIAGA